MNPRKRNGQLHMIVSELSRQKNENRGRKRGTRKKRPQKWTLVDNKLQYRDLSVETGMIVKTAEGNKALVVSIGMPFLNCIFLENDLDYPDYVYTRTGAVRPLAVKEIVAVLKSCDYSENRTAVIEV